MNPSLQELGIERLSIAERIELIGEIWDSITETDEKAPMPEWHRHLLEQRRATAEADPDAGTPWEVVRARLTRPS
jgi:putative addiction module component (TIGR02574 family)